MKSGERVKDSLKSRAKLKISSKTIGIFDNIDNLGFVLL
jgi:hypothetical protein